MERIVNSRIFEYEFLELQRLAKANQTTLYKLTRKIIRDYIALQNKAPKRRKQLESGV